MSGDEVFALLLSALLAMVAWWQWYWPAARIPWVRSSLRLPMLLSPPVAAAALLLVLGTLASRDVREQPAYLCFYEVMGAAWVGATMVFAAQLLDLHLRDDVLERGNAAGAALASGALAAFTFAFAGANIGDGPGWWVVVFSAALPTATLLLGWWILARLAGIGERITVERDLAAGIRLGAWLAAGGLILGRAVAGDWHSPAQTLVGFALAGWPVVPLLLAALALEQVFKDPATTRALSNAAACFYLAAAVAWILYLGVPA